MKKMMAMSLALVMALSLAACGSSNNAPAATEAPVMEAPTTEAATTEAPTTKATEAETSAEDASAEEGIDVGASYPVSTAYDEYAVTKYFFEETGEDVEMVVSTNTAHDKFQLHFTFFGDEQLFEFHLEDGKPVADKDLSGFITKDMEAMNEFVAGITEWTAIGSDASTDEIDVGASYPVSTAYDEYVVTKYFFEETGEEVEMVVSTNTAHDKFQLHFTFFGDEQLFEFHLEDGKPVADKDLSGFITKDMDKMNEFVGTITDWTAVK